MKEEKTFLDYVGSMFCRFGITVSILTILCVIFGESARELSEMFRLGDSGLAINTILQFLGVSLFSEIAQYLFLSSKWFKRVPELIRIACLLGSIILVIVIFNYFCGWFPMNVWQCWAMFLLCFSVCFGVSVWISVYKTKVENRKLEEGLAKLKESWREENE